MAIDFAKLSAKELQALVKPADGRAGADKSIDKARKQLADLKRMSAVLKQAVKVEASTK